MQLISVVIHNGNLFQLPKPRIRDGADGVTSTVTAFSENTMRNVRIGYNIGPYHGRAAIASILR